MARYIVPALFPFFTATLATLDMGLLTQSAITRASGFQKHHHAEVMYFSSYIRVFRLEPYSGNIV